MEDYNKIKKVLALGFMHILDENRTEGKMCLSNGECADIEKAFNEQDWPKLVRYLDKYYESEDEKIRKELIDFLRSEKAFQTIDLPISERWVAYLEKQKVQKVEIGSKIVAPVGQAICIDPELINLDPKPVQKEQKPAEKLSKEEYVKKFKALCDSYEIKLPNREYDIYGLCEDLHKLFGDIQKSTEWNDEDEAHRDFILESLEDQIRFCKKDAEGAHYAKQIRTAQNWLKFLSERFNLEPKQEWSEEDEKMLDSIIRVVCGVGIQPNGLREKQVSFLKSLRPQKLDASKLENFDPVDVLNRIKTEWPMAWEKVVGKQEWSEDWREEDIQTRFAFYTYKNEEDDGALYLSNVFVEESSRNHGFGTKILRAAEKVAETIGATTICLKVKQDSPANAWYRKNGYGYVAFEDGYDWLEKNLEYMKSNKQEWSKEETKDLVHILKVLDDCYIYGTHDLSKTDYDNLTSTLKSLRPQPKAELTLLDKNIINAAVAFVEQNNHFNCWGGIDKHTVIKALRSLKPSWKPSEEQMNGLAHAINLDVYDAKRYGLDSLYNDLKKL